MQETHTGQGVDLVAMAAGTGFRRTMLLTEAAQIPGLRTAIHAEGCLLAAAEITANAHKPVLPPHEGVFLETRLREAVLGPEAHHQL
jgi:hypothetical protein